MNIWLIDHYAVPTKYYPLVRQTIFAKKFMERGHSVKIFAASTVHNSNINLAGNKISEEIIEEGVNYVIIKCHNYEGNGLSRIMNMIEFAVKLPNVTMKYEKPDVIISTSMTLFACISGLWIGKRRKCKKIAQISDLWPETIIAYGMAKRRNPAVLFLRMIEKKIYKMADDIIFTMEGAYDYIIEQKWEKLIPKSKVHYINNGIDLETFDFNKKTYCINDNELQNTELFKVVYAGSIRKVNNLGLLLEVAKRITNSKVVILIWGDGDEKKELERRVKKEHIKNVLFKGKVPKNYIPYITSCADLNIAHSTESPIFRFGISLNKIFDYFAAGKPILCDFRAKYNPVIKYKAGVDVSGKKIQKIADIINEFSCMTQEEYDTYSKNARHAAEIYDFERLTEKMIRIIE
ncbi:hypothetical protein C818_02945 [Lachnospiraceae bacterium MD308]|nr:hypothetical protein C818_02945 [Lachnospiraceae bacterium MD308]MCI8504499.1 glycosyltransferase family 4 protein [Dorea sp.]